jgi:hypothetical protein
MKLSAFKPSRNCVHGFKKCCLSAKSNNQIVPGLAAKYEPARKMPHKFLVYLRLKNEGVISSWVEQMLDRLINQNELSLAIAQGMEDFEANWQDHYRGDEGVLAKMKKEGILGYLCLNKVIVDEVDQEVILSFWHDLKSQVLSFNGIALSFSEGHWTFNTDTYLSDYISEVQSKHISNCINRFIVSMDHEDKPEKDLSFFRGDWVFDVKLTERFLKEVYAVKSDLAFHLDLYKSLQYSIELPLFAIKAAGSATEFTCVDAKLEGNKIIMRLKFLNFPQIKETTLFYHKGYLVDSEVQAVLKKQQNPT